MGDLAGLAEMCALGTTQALSGACSSLMAGPNLMLPGRAPSPVRPVPRSVLCSLGWAGLFIARGEAQLPLLAQGLAGRSPAWTEPASGRSPSASPAVAPRVPAPRRAGLALQHGLHSSPGPERWGGSGTV